MHDSLSWNPSLLRRVRYFFICIYFDTNNNRLSYGFLVWNKSIKECKILQISQKKQYIHFHIDTIFVQLFIHIPIMTTNSESSLLDLRDSSEQLILPPNILLWRHGQSQSNIDQDAGNIRGKSNHYPLTDLGRAQATHLGEYIKKQYDISWKTFEIISSPALRARQTIEIVCDILKLNVRTVIIEPRLEERWYGDWEWRKESEVMTPEILRMMDDSRWQFRPPNGDSIQDIYDRTKSFLDTVCGSDKHYLICSHGFTIRCLLWNILGIHPGDIYRPEKWVGWFYNTGMIGLNFSKDGTQLVDDARTALFLPEDLRTK